MNPNDQASQPEVSLLASNMVDSFFIPDKVKFDDFEENDSRYQKIGQDEVLDDIKSKEVYSNQLLEDNEPLEEDEENDDEAFSELNRVIATVPCIPEEDRRNVYDYLATLTSAETIKAEANSIIKNSDNTVTRLNEISKNLLTQTENFQKMENLAKKHIIPEDAEEFTSCSNKFKELVKECLQKLECGKKLQRSSARSSLKIVNEIYKITTRLDFDNNKETFKKVIREEMIFAAHQIEITVVVSNNTQYSKKLLADEFERFMVFCLAFFEALKTVQKSLPFICKQCLLINFRHSSNLDPDKICHNETSFCLDSVVSAFKYGGLDVARIKFKQLFFAKTKLNNIGIEDAFLLLPLPIIRVPKTQSITGEPLKNHSDGKCTKLEVFWDHVQRLESEPDTCLSNTTDTTNPIVNQISTVPISSSQLDDIQDLTPQESETARPRRTRPALATSTNQSRAQDSSEPQYPCRLPTWKCKNDSFLFDLSKVPKTHRRLVSYHKDDQGVLVETGKTMELNDEVMLGLKRALPPQ